MTLNFSFSCLCVLSSEITDTHHHTWFMQCWTQALWTLDKHSTTRVTSQTLMPILGAAFLVTALSLLLLILPKDKGYLNEKGMFIHHQ